MPKITPLIRTTNRIVWEAAKAAAPVTVLLEGFYWCIKNSKKIKNLFDKKY